MRTCYVHFGMHKTGTSSIQQTLFALQGRDDWVYLNANTPNSSLALMAAFGEDPASMGMFRRLQLSAEQLQNRRDRVRRQLELQLARPASR